MGVCTKRGSDWPRRRARRGWQGVGLLLLSIAGWVPDAQAFKEIRAAEPVQLAENEGLLVVDISTTTYVNSLSFSRVDGSGRNEVLGGLEAGRIRALYVVPAGRYRWHEMNLRNWLMYARYKLRKDPEFAFEVQAGRINYAGELQIRPSAINQTDFHISNRMLPVIDWLEQHHAALYQQYPLHFSGHYPDPFPAFYRTERAPSAKPADDLNQGQPAPDAGALPMAPALLWAPAHVQSIALSPGGRLVAESVQGENGGWELDLIDLQAGTSQRLQSAPFAYADLTWKDDATLLATAEGGLNGERLTLFLIGKRTGERREFQMQLVPRAGRLVGILPEIPHRILFEFADSRGQLVVHAIDTSSPESIRRIIHVPSRKRLNRGVPGDLAWVADARGELILASARRGDDQVLMYGRRGSYSEILVYGQGEDFRPLTVSGTGTADRIYGLSDAGRAQRDLVLFDPVAKKITETVFSKPGIDVVTGVFDFQGVPIGAKYYAAGRLVTEYFLAEDRRLAQSLQAAFPGRTVALIDHNQDRRQLLLLVEASDQPPLLYHLDRNTMQASLIDQFRPDLAGQHFAPAKVLAINSSDGLSIEAYLTLPTGSTRHPLVVMPHGGPIGVSDHLQFDPEVQFLAALGYAVLQVNFRGSEGYGKAFREAGYRNFGRLIEDDIDAAIQYALAHHPLDAKRMCILGASYGGYSALISTIRWPGRFRCAVSIAGVSDQALFFTASDSARAAKTREMMERNIGNPNIDLAEMRETSPLYRFKELKVPLMLIHGREDRRVDFEHSRRLVRLLNLIDRPPVLLAFPDEGHGLEHLKNIVKAWTGIAGFLGEHLGRPVPPNPPPSGSR